MKSQILIQELKPDIQVDLIEIYQRKAFDRVQRFSHYWPAYWYDGELQGDWEEFIPTFR